jgi:predicted SAM-dependent methyltransferase
MKLNLGCGAYPKEGWTNYDLLAYPGVVSRDLTRGLPEPAGSVSLIFSEHFLEHLDQGPALLLLKDCWRVLRPGGKLQLVMPDLGRIAAMYHTKDYALLRSIGLWESNQGSLCRALNQAMRAWGHKFLWDEKEIAEALEALGFQTRLVGDDEKLGNRKLPTDLGIEAVKPIS